ncbi:MAG: InlB B-repeat-containing protein [Clostridia bacterium]|nr:InlB B-repeat-containing protein [Clostridia bacterium]
MPGPTIEVTGYDGSVRIFYEGCRITGGTSKESATILHAEDRKTAHSNSTTKKYRLIEPCDHEGTLENGECWACGWTAGSYYVTYELCEGEVNEVELVEAGETTQRPEDPVRAGFIFQDWYQVLEGGTLAADPYVFGAMLTDDITLRAVWLHQHDGITFEYWNGDGSLPTSAGSYCLTRDVTLPDTWTWSGGMLNLCLNGHSITANQINDPVIKVTGGILNLYDEAGGTVTQFDGRDSTVYVGANGTLNLHGGTVTGAANAYADPFGGVEVYGSFHMSGGTVTGNPRGVLVRGGTFTVSGSARVTGNAVNVLLPQSGKIQIDGALSSDALIGVSGITGVFTDGLSGNGDESNFFSDDNHYVVALAEDGENTGEAALEGAQTVTFEPGDENAEGDAFRMKVAHYLTLPDCGFSVAGKTFRDWSVKVGDNAPVSRQPNSLIEVTADTTVTAVWEISPFGTPDFMIPVGTLAIEANAFEGIAATVIKIPANCASIGNYAFRDCAHLLQIRIPAGCALGTDVFDGCGRVYIFSAAGSPAEAYCDSHSNCVFVEDAGE